MDKEELVKIYQETSEYSDSMKALEYEYILDNIQVFFDDYVEHFADYSLLTPTFQSFLFEKIGNWQVDNGFFADYDLGELIDVLGSIETGDE